MDDPKGALSRYVITAISKPELIKVAPRANPTKLFFIMFPFFAIKIDCFIMDTIAFICYMHSSLTARIGKQVKTKFGRIDSWVRFLQHL